MNKEQLQGLLNQKYNPENWNKIYGSIFPNVMLFASPKEIAISEQWVKSFRQRGLVRLNSNQDVAIFEVVLQDGISVQSKRVGLRNLVAKLIDEYQNHGVLAVFDNGSPEYRFTFAAKETKVTREGIEKSETDSKRYTYILGETETCKTAAEQFIKLAEKGTGISLTDLRDAFSVEKLSKQFFNEYKEQYNQFVGYLASQPKILKSVFGGDEKKMRDFVKLLLGRLVFLQFVQKKKWLGVPAKNKDWHSGDVNFLVNAFNGFANKDKFYSDYLEEFFFECLNNPNRKNEIFELSRTKIPFLNGGLFENDNIKTKNLNFPATYFNGLFDFFGKYNFTIDENDPTEKEVGIDPEMLGSIFENLLEDNKDKGAFYTPKEIVHYMCQESLIEYLNTKVNDTQDDALRESIRLFITKRKTDEHILKLVSPLANSLREVKICDPAIGSGAFPMGMLMEIFHAVFELYNTNPKIVSREWKMNGWQPNVVKSNIIQHSIYGVDIEKGAVDIARLRFWLSLIVDEEEPKALPNLDYKIVVGNSLISKLGNDIIDIDWEVKAISKEAIKLQQEIQNNLNKLFNTQKLFFDFNGKKENLKAEIRNLKVDVLICQLQLDKYKYRESSAQVGSLFGMTAKEKKAEKEQKHRLSSFDKTIAELQKLKFNPEQNLNFFDWKLDFPEVLNESINTTPGFDIVIGNPPYFEISDPDLKSRFQIKYKDVLSGHYDIYLFFYKLAFDLSSKKGIISLITPHTFLHYTQFAALRKYIYDNSTIIEITDRLPNIFENAVVDTSISILNKFVDQRISKFSIKKTNTEGVIDKDSLLISKAEFSDSTFDIKAIRKLKELNKFSSNTLPLGEIVESSQGITVYAKVQGEKINYFRDNGKEKNSKKYLKGRDFNKYQNNWTNGYIIYGKHLWCRRDPKFFEVPKIFVRQTSDSIIATFIEEPFYAIDSVHSLISKNQSFDLKYILSILNSRLGDYLFHLLINEDGKVFAQVKLTFLRRIPIKLANRKIQTMLIKRVDKILSLKLHNEDTADIEIEIDNLVYRLYELSFDEIKVIDPEFPLSKKEYDAIKLD